MEDVCPYWERADTVDSPVMCTYGITDRRLNIYILLICKGGQPPLEVLYHRLLGELSRLAHTHSTNKQ